MMRMGVPKGEKLGGHHKFALIWHFLRAK
jgi:hypothetical protein